jgi:gas vesicle protein
MKTRIVMWGSNEKDQKVLIAISLRAADNVVDVFTFPFETTTEEFYNLMLNEWREAHEVPFPEGFTHIIRPLTASDSILPEGLKVDRSDIIQRAQTEWHFVVLSNKLYQSFLHELEDIKEKLKSADNYKNNLWEEMKESWEKIQKNIFDKTLLREHGQQLREMTNDIFTQLKDMRKNLDTEVDRVSREFADKFNTKLDEVEEKIKSGLGLQPLFNDLKRMQQEFKDAELSRGDRAKIWKRIDNAFKAVKEKKFGEKSTRDTSALDRLSRRYEGLMSAIDKMEKSIRRDDKDKHFQDDRIANTEGQLEAQIRMAKLKMIDERVNSKNEKLAEMLKTKVELEERINREKKFLEDQKKQQVMKEELKEAKENVKQKIADTIHAQADQLDAEALGKAAEAIAEEKARKSKGKPKETLLGAIGDTLGESLTDLGDSLGAVASVIGDKIEETFKDMKEEAKEKSEQAENLFDNLKKETGEKADDMKEGAQHVAEEVKEKAQDFKEEIKERAEKVGDSLGEMTDDAKEKLASLTEEAKEKFSDFKEAAGNLSDEAKEKIGDIADEAKEKFAGLKEAAGHLSEEAQEKLGDLADDLKSAFNNIASAFSDEKKEGEEPEEKKEDQA